MTIYEALKGIKLWVKEYNEYVIDNDSCIEPDERKIMHDEAENILLIISDLQDKLEILGIDLLNDLKEN